MNQIVVISEKGNPLTGRNSIKASDFFDSLRILIVEDVPTDAELARREISKTFKSCTYRTVETREDYLRELRDFGPDIIVSDYRMPHFSGLEALRLALEKTPFTPVIILTGAINEDTAVECMKAGATDYVIKEHIKRLGLAITQALKRTQTRRDRARAEEALHQSEERLRVLFQNIPVPTFVWKARNEQFVLTEYNEAAVQFTGNKIGKYTGKAADQIFAHMPQIAIDIEKCMSSRRTVENQYWCVCDDLSEKKYVVVKYAFAAPDSVLMHVNDITVQKQAEEGLQFVSIHDSLTGLYNRFYADAEIERLSGGRIRPVSVIVIDLNDLKKVNDKCGHMTGDLYIKNAAAILKQSFRTEDMIARLGGDEFLVLLPSADETACAQAVDRLYENVELFNRSNKTEISLSAGTATTNENDSILESIRIADKRMYHEKACRKSGIYRTSEIDSVSVAECV